MTALTADRVQRSKRISIWRWIHRWSSLVCTASLLLICITGLPLLFHDEISHWSEPHTYKALPADTPLADLDRIVATGRHLYPKETILSIFIDDDEPQGFLYLTPSWAAYRANPRAFHFIRFDTRTGEILERSEQQRPQTFITWMGRLHTDLFAGLPGELFLAVMALLFIVAIISGVILYGPFTRKLAFGTMRPGRSAHLKWLDLHNLMGVTTLAWLLVVSATGAMNELSTPLFAAWQRTDVAAMLAPWRGKIPPAPAEMVSVQGVYKTAQRALPGMAISSIVFPGAPVGSPHHYMIWGRGETPLTARLLSPVLIDARTGKLTAVVRMPWYLRALEVSRPLHFGDYGGMPLKILWALLDLVTIVVLGSGLYLWIARPRRERAAARAQALHGASPVMEPAE